MICNQMRAIFRLQTRLRHSVGFWITGLNLVSPFDATLAQLPSLPCNVQSLEIGLVLQRTLPKNISIDWKFYGQIRKRVGGVDRDHFSSDALGSLVQTTLPLKIPLFNPKGRGSLRGSLTCWEICNIILKLDKVLTGFDKKNQTTIIIGDVGNTESDTLCL